MAHEVKQSFKRFDTSCNGLISTQELATVCKLLGLQWGDGDFAALYKYVHVSIDSKVDYNELVDWVFHDTTIGTTVEILECSGASRVVSVPKGKQTVVDLKEEIQKVTGVLADDIMLLDGSICLLNDAPIPSGSLLAMVTIARLPLLEFFTQLAALEFAERDPSLEFTVSCSADFFDIYVPGQSYSAAPINAAFERSTGELYLEAHDKPHFTQEHMEYVFSKVYDCIKPRLGEDVVRLVYLGHPRRVPDHNWAFHYAARAFQVAHSDGRNAERLAPRELPTFHLECFMNIRSDTWMWKRYHYRVVAEGYAKYVEGYERSVHIFALRLKDTTAKVRHAALIDLDWHFLDEAISSRFDEAMLIVGPHLKDVNAEVRAATANILCKVAARAEREFQVENAERAMLAVASLFKDEDTFVRLSVWAAIAHVRELISNMFTSGNREIRDAFMDGFKDADAEVRLAVWRASSHVKEATSHMFTSGYREMKDGLMAGLADANLSVGNEARKALARDNKALKAIADSLGDADDEGKKQVMAMALHSHVGRELLARCLSSLDSDVRVDQLTVCRVWMLALDEIGRRRHRKSGPIEKALVERMMDIHFRSQALEIIARAIESTVFDGGYELRWLCRYHFFPGQSAEILAS